MAAQRDGLIASCIRASLAGPWITLLLAAVVAACGIWSITQISVDALPDLSDVQVIVRTNYEGRAPQVVEDQITFPLTSSMRAVPGATVVRGYSLFGDSFVYVLFADGTDPYWARSRVLERLSQVQSRLPSDAHPALGPDATGVGWIFEYALLDRSGRHDVAQLRSLQDWWLRYELQSIPGVAEVAALGGMVKEYQVVVQPEKLRAYRVTLAQVRSAISQGNAQTGGSALELAEAEYMIRASGYVRSMDDLRHIPLRVDERGVAICLGDVADVRLGPQMRRGIADLDGGGEVAGGAIVMRNGADARATIAAVRQRLAEIAPQLPAGIQIVPAYDRSTLIDRAIETLRGKLLYELIAIFIVCLLFLSDAPAALIVVAVLPLGILAALLIMHLSGVSANIMSLGGIAIAVGAMVDAAIVMAENAQKKLERAAEAGGSFGPAQRFELIAAACVEVGPALFFSLLIIALSFVPVLALQAQEGKLFTPLAYTKTCAMLAAALASVTVVPVLVLLAIRKPRRELANPLNRIAAALYRPVLTAVLRRPAAAIAVAAVLTVATAWPLMHTGTEFLPDLDEGDLLYMPASLPGISPAAARALLQTADRLIAGVPEVEHVLGKAGRSDSATDPAPLEMLEVLVKLKPRRLWRPGLDRDGLIAELDRRLQLPGVTNVWLPPIKARIDMLSTGIRTPLAIRIAGPSLEQIQKIGMQIERIVRAVPGSGSVYSERVAGGRYIDVEIDRAAAARFGLNIGDVDDFVELAVGGKEVGQTVEGRERYPINLRYPQEWRDSPEKLRSLPILSAQGASITLGDVAAVRVADGPAQIRSEDARPVGWVYITPARGDLSSLVTGIQTRIEAAHVIPAGYSIQWSGDYKHLERAFGRLRGVVPVTLLIIVVLLYLSFRNAWDVGLVLAALPISLIGGAWTIWLLGYRLSVATVVGCIALAGIAVETGVIMLIFLNAAWSARRVATPAPTLADLHAAIIEGALLRLRPKLMTVMAIIFGLLPLLLGNGAGAEVMKRIAAPMVGGMLSALLATLLVIPAFFSILRSRTDLPAA